MGKQKKFWIILAGCLLAVALAGGIWFWFWQNAEKELAQQAGQHQAESREALLQLSKDMEAELEKDQVYTGVSVMGVELGGKTKAEAKTALESEIAKQILDQKLTLTYKEQKWTFTMAELGVSVDTMVALEEAYKLGRSGDLRQRRQVVAQLAAEPVEIEAKVTVDDAVLQKTLEAVAQELHQDVVNATISRSNGSFVITPDESGQDLDLAKTKAAVEKVVKGDRKATDIALEVNEVQASRTAEELSTISDTIGSASTYYSTSNYGREQNLIVGSSKISGTVLMPGEVLSFNELVAPITVENGYHEANVIVGDEYVPGLGGGLCQVSTTLYNAVILAELGLVERDCHAFPAAYVPLGLDAAVAQGYIDFKFENTSGYPVYIEMWAGGGEIGAAIYGTEIHDPSRTLSFDYVVTGEIGKPEAEITEDASLAPGERIVTSEGHIGYEVDVYKTVTENGTSYTEYFNSSSYMASADKIKVGPKKK